MARSPGWIKLGNHRPSRSSRCAWAEVGNVKFAAVAITCGHAIRIDPRKQSPHIGPRPPRGRCRNSFGCPAIRDVSVRTEEDCWPIQSSHAKITVHWFSEGEDSRDGWAAVLDPNPIQASTHFIRRTGCICQRNCEASNRNTLVAEVRRACFRDMQSSFACEFTAVDVRPVSPVYLTNVGRKLKNCAQTLARESSKGNGHYGDRHRANELDPLAIRRALVLPLDSPTVRSAPRPTPCLPGPSQGENASISSPSTAEKCLMLAVSTGNP